MHQGNIYPSPKEKFVRRNNHRKARIPIYDAMTSSIIPRHTGMYHRCRNHHASKQASKNIVDIRIGTLPYPECCIRGTDCDTVMTSYSVLYCTVCTYNTYQDCGRVSDTNSHPCISLACRAHHRAFALTVKSRASQQKNSIAPRRAYLASGSSPSTYLPHMPSWSKIRG